MATLRPEQIVSGYLAATRSIRDRVLKYTSTVWKTSPAFRDVDIDRIVARIVPVVQAGQMQVAQLTDAYIGRMSVLAGATWTSGFDKSLVDYRGVPAGEVYRRPAKTVYTKLSEGVPFDAALAAGTARLTSIVATDIQQVKNRQAQRSVGQSGFDAFRRVLTGSENCALCTIASTQRYHKNDLLPIHPGCDCGVEPYIGSPSTQVIDPDLLELTHSEIDLKLSGTDRGARDLGLGKTSSSGQPLSDFTDLIVSREHGELGPTLVWRSDHFTGPEQIAALAH